MISYTVFHHCETVLEIRVAGWSFTFLYLHFHPAEFILLRPVLPTTHCYYTYWKCLSVCVTDKLWALIGQGLHLIHEDKTVEEMNEYLKKKINHYLSWASNHGCYLFANTFPPPTPTQLTGRIFFLIFVFLGPHLWHTEFPRSEVESEL